MEVTEPKPSSLRLLILAPSASSIDKSDPSTSTEILRPSSTKTLFSGFLNGLTKSEPSADLETFAGYTSHPPLRLRTKYYSADVSLWCDELVNDSPPNDGASSWGLSEWSAQMMSTEAKEVRDVIGGILLLLPYSHTGSTGVETRKTECDAHMKYVQAVNEVRDAIEDESGRDVATVVVVQDMTPGAAAERAGEGVIKESLAGLAEALEESCISDHGIFGWDVVSWQPECTPAELDGQAQARRNEHGEHTGMARVLEVLEQTDWSALGGESADDGGYLLAKTEGFLDDEGDDNKFMGPGLKAKIIPRSQGTEDSVAEQSDEFQREIMGLHFALEDQSRRETGAESDSGSGDDLQVEQLTELMDRAVATREAGAEMSKEDRERFARREVEKMMRELNMA